MASEGSAECIDVWKSFGGVPAIQELNLRIDGGEFFTLLGPSGCGKTTTLRMLGGFTVPDRGSIHLGGEDVTFLPSYRRDTNTVFQSYALFDHLTVAGNVAFGLRRRRVPKAEIRTRVGEMLEMVDLIERADAMPKELSGGQRQRVALARALVNLPKVLLLDEPLGALDLQLRRQMQLELKRIQREMGITFIFVTHDQEEALVMSDRIAVLHRGRVEQIGTPSEIYTRPQSVFVAQFIGSTNMFRGQAEEGGLRLGGGQVVQSPSGASYTEGTRVCLSVRPQKLSVLGAEPLADPSAVTMKGRVSDMIYHGSETQYVVDLHHGQQVHVAKGDDSPPNMELSSGEEVVVQFRVDDAVVLTED